MPEDVVTPQDPFCVSVESYSFLLSPGHLDCFPLLVRFWSLGSLLVTVRVSSVTYMEHPCLSHVLLSSHSLFKSLWFISQPQQDSQEKVFSVITDLKSTVT